MVGVANCGVIQEAKFGLGLEEFVDDDDNDEWSGSFWLMCL